MALPEMDLVGSGTTKSISSSTILPKPWHSGQAPNGLLNENNRGCGISYAMPHPLHSNRSENRCRCVAASPEPPAASGTRDSIAHAAPPPSRYAVSTESVIRCSESASICTRSTTTERTPCRTAADRSTSSNDTARPSTRVRPKPFRLRASNTRATAASLGGASSGMAGVIGARPLASSGNNASLDGAPASSATSRTSSMPSATSADSATSSVSIRIASATGASNPIMRRVPRES